MIIKATLLKSGQVAWLVPSSSEENKFHLVSFSDTDGQYACDCKSYTHRRRCAHKAQVLTMKAEQAREVRGVLNGRGSESKFEKRGGHLVPMR